MRELARRALTLALRALQLGESAAKSVGKGQGVATNVTINADQQAVLNIAVAGALVGDNVVVNQNLNQQLTAGLVAQGYVSAPDNVTVLVVNTSDAPIGPTTFAIDVMVVR